MGNKHLNRSIIPNNTQQHKVRKYINNDPSILHGWGLGGDRANVFVSLRFVQYQQQCFSDWDKGEMRGFWAFLEKIHDYTWEQIYRSGGKQDKTGFAYTPLPLHLYPETDFKQQLDPNITMFELRVDGEMRVHCFRDKSVCYVCWLDKNHEICN